MNTYTFLWSNAHQLFYMRGNIDSYIKYKDIAFNSAEAVFQVSHGATMTCYLGTKDLGRHVEEGRVFLSRDFAKMYIKNALQQYAKHNVFFEEFKQTSFQDQTNPQLLSLWRGLLDHYAHSVAYFRSTQEEPSRALVEHISSIVSSEDLNLLLLSPDLDEINKEDIAWQEIMKAGFTRERARKHLKKFTWLFQNVLSHEETIDELEQRAAQSVYRNIQEEKDQLRKKQHVILEKYPAVKAAVQTLHELALLRPKIKAVWGSTGFYALPILVEVAKRTKEDLHTLVFFYRHEDVELLLEKNKKLSESEIADRKQCTAYVIRNGKLLNFVGQEAENIKREELGIESKGDAIKELKGMSARPGKVQGFVHILRVNDPESAQQFRASFNKGILVTSMTQPNIVDIAQRASAIITDEGGMLCHAAIISREFGIPCIVGTHTATHVLKDGDLVEVDADNGVVRILKKK